MADLECSLGGKIAEYLIKSGLINVGGMDVRQDSFSDEDHDIQTCRENEDASFVRPYLIILRHPLLKLSHNLRIQNLLHPRIIERIIIQGQPNITVQKHSNDAAMWRAKLASSTPLEKRQRLR